MSSDSNTSDLSSNGSSSYEESGSSSDEAVGVVSSQFLPYMNEPSARSRVGLQDGDSRDEEDDVVTVTTNFLQDLLNFVAAERSMQLVEN